MDKCIHRTLLLQWRHNKRNGVSFTGVIDCLLNHMLRRWSKKISKLRVTGLCVGIHRWPVNSPHKRPVMRKMFPLDDVIMTGHVITRPLDVADEISQNPGWYFFRIYFRPGMMTWRSWLKPIHVAVGIIIHPTRRDPRRHLHWSVKISGLVEVSWRMVNYTKSTRNMFSIHISLILICSYKLVRKCVSK